jgi:hypothetical protein
MLIVNGGVYTEIEETKIDEYKSKGWVLASDYNQLENAKAEAEARVKKEKEIAELQQKRAFELMSMKKEEQVEILEKLCLNKPEFAFEGIKLVDLIRGEATNRVKAILELEKGI